MADVTLTPEEREELIAFNRVVEGSVGKVGDDWIYQGSGLGEGIRKALDALLDRSQVYLGDKNEFGLRPAKLTAIGHSRRHTLMSRSEVHRQTGEGEVVDS